MPPHVAWWAATLVVLGWVTAAWATPDAPGGTSLTVSWAVVLGALQGATEFLPVSSSGHLSLGQALLGIDAHSVGHRFNITVHAGTLIAVVWVYRRDVVELIGAAARPLVPGVPRRRLAMVLLASVPLFVVLLPGVEDMVIAMESRIRWVGIALWVTAAVLFFAFRRDRATGSEPSEEPPSPRVALLIGVAQLVAVIPGISRSGMTIAAGLALGLDRASAARFSFLISLVAVGGASAKATLDMLGESDAALVLDPAPFVAGFVAALAVGLVSLRALLYLVGKGRVGVFVVYLAIVGGLAVVLG